MAALEYGSPGVWQPWSMVALEYGSPGVWQLWSTVALKFGFEGTSFPLSICSAVRFFVRKGVRPENPKYFLYTS